MRMEPNFTSEAGEVEDTLYESDRHAYDQLWMVLDRIAQLGEEAKYVPWVSYVSSREIWGTRIPGTNYTVFWRIDGDEFSIAHILKDVNV